MTRDFFDPPWEQTNIVLVDAATVRRSERLIIGCEECNPDEAELPFDNVLDRVTGNDPSVTDYVLEGLAKCPRCLAQMIETTLVALDPGDKPSTREAVPL